MNSNNNKLEFTGNWFIDAGILGFVNLMEEVYGWDLEELRNRIKEEPEIIYYGYFPLAYLFYHSKIRESFKQIRKIREKTNKLIENKNKRQNELVELEAKEKEMQKLKKREFRKLEQKIEKINSKIVEIDEKIEEYNKEIKELREKLETEKNDLKNTLTDTVKNVLKDSKNGFVNYIDKIKNLILDFDLDFPFDHRNFFLYNPKKDLFTSFVYLYYLLREDVSSLYKFASKVSIKKRSEGLTYEIYPDSTMNPFLHSPSEFSNIGYTNPLSIDKIKEGLKLRIPTYLLLLSFSNAFQPPISRRYIMFYTNNLETSYSINGRIRIYSKRVGESTSIFQITWMSIIDELTERKAKFSLGNMYLVEFEGIENQKLKGVEFIDIPKLQASIIIDDVIRDSININLKTSEKGDKQYLWLLEEFIKNKPLLPVFYKNLRLYFNNNKKNKPPSKKTLIYGSAVDRSILDLEGNKGELFSDEFFNRYKKVIDSVKEYARKLFAISNDINLTFSNLSQDERHNLAYTLFGRIRKNQKYDFVNILLKELNQIDNKEYIERIVKFLFEDILNDDKTWQHNAIAIISGLIKRGGDYGETGRK